MKVPDDHEEGTIRLHATSLAELIVEQKLAALTVDLKQNRLERIRDEIGYMNDYVIQIFEDEYSSARRRFLERVTAKVPVNKQQGTRMK
jgi:hypothetical protein